MQNENLKSAKSDKATDIGFYALVILMGVSLVAIVGFLIYSLLS